MHEFLGFQIAHDVRGLVVATGGVASVLILVVVFLLRTKRTGWVLASYLVGTLVGLPAEVYLFNQRTQLAMPNVPLVVWLFELLGMWVAAWIPFGALGLGVGWIIQKRRSKTESSEHSAPEEPASTTVRNRQEALAVKLMLGFSATIWILSGIAHLLQRAH